MADEVWAVGDAYEAYVGRWSALVAEPFLRWLDVPARRRWLDVGCGTGALTAGVLATADPAWVAGVDRSAGLLASARTAAAATPRCVADARALPFADGTFDAVISGLVLNFVPEPARALDELVRLVAPGGVVAGYVWDYAEGMAMMRHFWDAAIAMDPAVVDRDQGRRFPLCRPGPLGDLWAGAGLRQVAVAPIEIPTVFADFDDYWRPFLGGQGTAPGYVASLPEPGRIAVRERLRADLPVRPDGSIALMARAWAVRGVARAR